MILTAAGRLTGTLSKAVHTVAAFLAGDNVAEKDRVRARQRGSGRLCQGDELFCIGI